MADYRTLFPGKYIQSADFKGKEPTVTIASVHAEEIEDKTKAVVKFHETKKAWIMNRTCAEAIKLMFGPDTDDWIGKRVTLFAATIKDPFGDGEITAIRVKGSPDISKASSATVQRGRKTLKVAVVPTGKAKQQPVSNANQHKANGAVIDVPAGMTEEQAEQSQEMFAEEVGANG